MFHRRREDVALVDASAAAEPALPAIAVTWLQDLLRAEFADDPFPTPAVAAPRDAEDEDAEALAVWRREWVRRWRRLQLPEQLAAYGEALEAARTPREVHGTLATHAAQIVGAYVALVFLPTAGGRLEPLPEPRLDIDGLWLHPDAAQRTGVVAAAEAAPPSPFAGAAPLFTRARAVALFVAACGDGVVVLVERRAEREFEEVDGALLGLLCAQADAALRRVRLLDSLGAVDAPVPGAAGRLEQVLRHAWAGGALGHPVTFVAVRCGPADEAEACEGALRRELYGAGPVLRTGPREFAVVLHGDVPTARALLDRVRAHLAGRAPLHAGMVAHDPAAGSARELLRRAQAQLPTD